ncbi:MAG: spondin domain-containing protein [Planctomycetota bacterium JB042]
MSNQPLLALVAAAALAPAATSQPVRLRVSVENLSPVQGTYLTPPWVAFHDGTFDVYDDGVAASAALESMAEDGDSDGLAAAFVGAATGQAQGRLGFAPIAPGGTAAADFLLDPTTTTARFGTMVAAVIPSNDAFVGNEDSLGVPIFDVGGNLVATNLFLDGGDVWDAGTEVNDELPASTHFLGQETPGTGTDEGGTVGLHGGYGAAGSGGILDDPSFSEGDFTESGYPLLKIRYAVADAVTEARAHTATLDGDAVVPAVSTKATGNGSFDLVIGGTTMAYEVKFPKKKLKKVTGASLNLGAVGVDGPVVVDLFSPDSAQKKLKKLAGSITSADLVGPLAAMPLDALVGAIADGDVYMVVTTTKNPDGEIRGQLELSP